MRVVFHIISTGGGGGASRAPAISLNATKI
jgi:hypothetical protein